MNIRELFQVKQVGLTYWWRYLSTESFPLFKGNVIRDFGNLLVFDEMMDQTNSMKTDVSG
jgi:hypothetical protein